MEPAKNIFSHRKYWAKRFGTAPVLPMSRAEMDQLDWHSPAAFKALGKPNLFYGVTAGNMDSMVNRYTADRKIRSDDAYTPNAEGNKRPDRAVIVYSQRAREAYPG